MFVYKLVFSTGKIEEILRYSGIEEYSDLTKDIILNKQLM